MNAAVLYIAVASSSFSSPATFAAAAPLSSSSATIIITPSSNRRAPAAAPSPSASGIPWWCRVPRGGSIEDDDDEANEVVEVEVDSGSQSSVVAAKKKKKKKKTTTAKRKKSKSLKQKSSINAPTDAEVEDEDNDDDEVATDTSISTAKKNTISNVMKGKDAASILGDGIRQRANILRHDPLLLPSSSFLSYDERILDTALVSVGLSLGTAGTDQDPHLKIRNKGEGEEEDDDDEDENAVRNTVIQPMAYYQYGHRGDDSQDGRRGKNTSQRPATIPSTSSTTMVGAISDYFLKTHGGTHIVQFLLSLLTSGLGVACLILPPFPSSTSYLSASTKATTIAGAGTATVTTKPSSSSSSILSHQILRSTLKYQLLQQTLVLGMAKHASGLLGAALIGATQIPNLGLRNVRRHLELVASVDPLGRYLFYCSLLVVWMGWFTGGCGGSGGASSAAAAGNMRDYIARMRGSILSIMNAAAATTAAAAAASAASTASSSSPEGGGGDTRSSSSSISQEAAVTTQLLNTLMESPPPWFLSRSYGYILPILILMPVLLREIISVIWVISDVLSLMVVSTKSKSVKVLLGSFLSSCRTILDGSLRVLLAMTSNTNEELSLSSYADSFHRQRTLAVLVLQCSSVMELAVGGILFWDAIQSFWNFAFVTPTVTMTTTTISGARLPFKCVLGKMACAHLYLNFLQSTKRRKATTPEETSVLERADEEQS
jgi:hypothetical protein